MISHFSHAAHHVQNKQDHEDNYIDNIMEEIDEIEHDEEELEKVKDNPVIYNARLEHIKDTMDMDFLNRHTIEGIVEDMTELQWKINIGIKIEVE